MRNVRDQLDLAQLQAAKRGFILNLRPDYKRLHWAGCDSIGGMKQNEHPKRFFETLAEAREWADKELGPQGWIICNKCGAQPQPT